MRSLPDLVQDYPSVKLNGFLGLMDPGYDVQRDHKTIIREMGAASVVLLKNQDDILPIRSHRVKEIAIVGSDAGNNLLYVLRIFFYDLSSLT